MKDNRLLGNSFNILILKDSRSRYNYLRTLCCTIEIDRPFLKVIIDIFFKYFWMTTHKRLNC